MPALAASTWMSLDSSIFSYIETLVPQEPDWWISFFNDCPRRCRVFVVRGSIFHLFALWRLADVTDVVWVRSGTN